MATRLELEIAEQPQVLRRMVEEQRPQIAAIARAIREAQPRYVMIVARGTSDNAARYAQYRSAHWRGWRSVWRRPR